MIALDTNVLVRLLVGDDEAQGRVAQQLLHDAEARAERIFVSAVVLAELEWVLRSCYKASKDDVLLAVRGLLEHPLFDLDRSAAVEAALDQCFDGRADLSDYLIGSLARTFGATTTYTFDRALGGQVGFSLLR